MNTCERAWRHKTDGVIVRVIDYRLAAIYRLVTSILHYWAAPAAELARLIMSSGKSKAPWMNSKPTCPVSRLCCVFP
jgi:hypothetical protein